MVEMQGLAKERIINHARNLPTTARILGVLKALLDDPNSGVEEICVVLKRDTALTARIIRISNSPYLGSGIPHGSIEEAVGCVGFTEIFRLVGFAVGSQLVSKDLSYYGYTASQLWNNTVMTAIAMEFLARLRGSDPRSAYTAGLMRSIGKIVLDRCATEFRSGADTMSRPVDERVGVYENRSFGCNNSAVTAMVLQEWHFPADLSKAIFYHYEPEEHPQAGALAYLLNFASWIAFEQGYGLPGEEAYWVSRPSKSVRLGLSEKDLERCGKDIAAIFEKIRQIFG